MIFCVYKFWFWGGFLKISTVCFEVTLTSLFVIDIASFSSEIDPPRQFSCNNLLCSRINYHLLRASKCRENIAQLSNSMNCAKTNNVLFNYLIGINTRASAVISSLPLVPALACFICCIMTHKCSLDKSLNDYDTHWKLSLWGCLSGAYPAPFRGWPWGRSCTQSISEPGRRSWNPWRNISRLCRCRRWRCI